MNPSPKSKSTHSSWRVHAPNAGKAIVFPPVIKSSPSAAWNHQTLIPPKQHMGPANLLFFLFLVLLTTTVSCASMARRPLNYPTVETSTMWINDAKVHFDDSAAPHPILLGLTQERDPYLSAGFVFAAGFVCTFTPACDTSLFAIFIVHVYNGMFDQRYPVQVVWSANQASPVRENATLELTTDGNLVLHDVDGTHVWSSNSSGRSVARMGVTETGNLVLSDEMNAIVWQSFDHPTDTLVPGQSLLEGRRLTANTSPTNSTVNQFYITVVPDGLSAYYAESTPPQLYFSYQTKIGKVGNSPTKAILMNGKLSFILRPDMSDNITLPENYSAQYMRLDSDGHLRLYGFGTEWTVVSDVMGSVGMDDCAYPTVCGEYGICTQGQCTCPLQNYYTLSYFRPVDERKPNLGCTPSNPISCQAVQWHHLLTLVDISYFDKNPIVLNATSINDCKQACLKNCSCMAVLLRAGECVWVTKVISLHAIQPENAGYNSSAYLKVQLSPSMSAPNTNKKKVVLAATLGVLATLVVFVISSTLYLQRMRKYDAKGEEFDFEQLPGMPTRFSFLMLSKCTEGFRTKLGEGGFGSVFEGKLCEQRVAVKRLEGAKQGTKEFLAEVETIGSIEHINLVKLIGFCAEKSERLLVYEYMPRGSLDRWIYYHHNNAPLDWCTRCRIILHIAKGLCYLHEECRRKIAHLDIKPQNILLDDNFNAKVADFGLCKLINRDQSKVVTVMRGTPGYLAPEWLTSRITEKVDVYSFGVVVMEIVSGRKNIDHSRPEEEIQLINLLREKAQNNQLIDLIDKHSDDVVSHQEEVIQMMKLAIWCLQNDSIGRPSMSTVIKVLEGAMSVETFDPNSVMYVPDNISTYSVPQASALSGPR